MGFNPITPTMGKTMNCLKTHSQKTFFPREIFLSLILLAFALKAFIPAGFMPDFTGGMTKMVICSGMGEKTIYVPNDDNTSPPPEHSGSADYCAYQISSSSKDLMPFLQEDIKPFENLVSTLFYAVSSDIQTHFQHVQNARAPPSLS